MCTSRCKEHRFVVVGISLVGTMVASAGAGTHGEPWPLHFERTYRKALLNGIF